jgi:hypothetical protein
MLDFDVVALGCDVLEGGDDPSASWSTSSESTSIASVFPISFVPDS